MKKIYSTSLLLLLLVLTTLAPLYMYAQEDEEGVLLLEQSLPGIEGRVTDLGEYLNSIFLVAVGVAAALAVVMITIGGVQYMTSESFGGKDAGREKISAAAWGLVLALAAFLILNTINPDLLEFRIVDALTSLRERIQVQREAIKAEGDLWPWEEGNLIRDRLREASLNSVGQPQVYVRGTQTTEECRFIGEIGCTSVYGLQPFMYNDGIGFGLPELAEATGCIVTVTAGTEYWAHGNRSHVYEINNSSHKTGRVVDINDASCIDEKILEGYTREGVLIQDTNELICFEKIEKYGVTFQWEAGSCVGSTGSHWHVEF